jgi:hypothetical protein
MTAMEGKKVSGGQREPSDLKERRTCAMQILEGNGSLGRRNSKCKGPEAGAFLVCSGKTNECSRRAAGVCTLARDEVREAERMFMCPWKPQIKNEQIRDSKMAARRRKQKACFLK